MSCEWEERGSVWVRGRGGFRGNEEEGCLRESVCSLPGHEVPSWGCWGCVGGAVHEGTAESRVVPLRKKSDIREGRGKMWVYTWRNYPIKLMRGRRLGGGGVSGESVGSLYFEAEKEKQERGKSFTFWASLELRVTA